MSKSTSFMIRINKDLKQKFEDICGKNKEIPSVVARSLITDYCHGVPTMRQLLEKNNDRLDALLEILDWLKKGTLTEINNE